MDDIRIHNRDSNPSKSSKIQLTEQKMGNYHKVEKGEFFIEEWMTLITEVDSDKYLDMAARSRRAQKKEEIHAPETDYLERLEDWS